MYTHIEIGGDFCFVFYYNGGDFLAVGGGFFFVCFCYDGFFPLQIRYRPIKIDFIKYFFVIYLSKTITSLHYLNEF